MVRASFFTAQHLQACSSNPALQLFAAAQIQVFGQIGNNQPAFATRQQMCCQPLQKAAQHAAVFVINGVIQQRCHLARQPGRVADDQARLPFGEQIRMLQLHLSLMTESLQVFACAGQSTFACIGRNHGLDAALEQQSRQHTRAHTDVPCLLHASSGQGRPGNQFQILATHRRENAVVGMNAGAIQRGNLHAFFAPFVCANHAQQVTQRNQHRAGLALHGYCAPAFTAGLTPVGRTAQFAMPLRIQLNQNAGQHARTLRLRLAVQVKRVGKFRLGGRLAAGLLIQPAAQRQQQLAGVLEIAPPQQRRTFADMAKRRICGHGVVGKLYATGFWQAAFGAPQGLLGLVFVLPLQQFESSCGSGD